MKQFVERLNRSRRDLSRFRVVFDMLNRLHPDEGGSDSRSRAGKLNRPLSVRGEAAERLANESRKLTSKLSLHNRCTGHDRDAEGMGGLKEIDGFRPHRLIPLLECFQH